MTTIAFDGTTLAADTKNCVGGMPFPSTKAFRLKDGRLFGGSGCAEDCVAVKEWLDGGDKPTVKEFAALLIEGEQVYRLEDRLIKIPVEARFHAVGSGRDYAMAAMHLGKTAREAIEIASLYDIYTGAPITELRIK